MVAILSCDGGTCENLATMQHLAPLGKAYPVLQIKHPRDLYLCIKDVKMHICDILWKTLSIPISSNELRLTFDVNKNGKKYRHHLADDISVYQAIRQCDLEYTSSSVCDHR